MVFLLPTNIILSFCQKSKGDLLPKIHKVVYGISPARKIKEREKTFNQSNTH